MTLSKRRECSRAFTISSRIRTFTEDSMNQFAMESRQISRSRIALVGGVVLLVVTILSSAQEAPPGVKFEVVSVRVLGSKEAADRSPDFVGPNIAIRLRLSTSTHGLVFYGWKNSAVPAGYKVQSTDRGVSWLYGKGGTEKRASSPGLKAVLFGSTGEWITLPAHSAIEWEELDATSFAGEKHGFTAFIKQRDADQPLEVLSDSFAVPFDPTPKTH
jgi:hypothetical protein